MDLYRKTKYKPQIIIDYLLRFKFQKYKRSLKIFGKTTEDLQK